MSTQYLKNAMSPATQGEIMPGQVANSDGCAVFSVDDWTRLDRFLILGSEGGSYYATERKLTKENAAAVERCIKADGVRAVKRIVEISDSGRAPKNDPAIFALALAAKNGDLATRQAAYAAVPRVCRIGTHLYHFVAFAKTMGGWGRGLRRAVANWFRLQDAGALAFQLVKYQQRDGWSARDLMRLSHPKAPSALHNSIFEWATSKEEADVSKVVEAGTLPEVIVAYELAKKASTAAEVATLVREFKLPRECVPTQHLKSPVVWEALLPHMGLTAMVRNLGNMTKIGLVAPGSDAAKLIATKVTDATALKKARVHPIALLTALLVYKAGRGVRGSSTWQPVTQVIDALDAAFYASFGYVPPTNKRIMLALDVSGSMSGGDVAGVPGLTPRVASTAMAMVTAAADPTGFHASGFSSRFIDLDLSPRRRLDDNCKLTASLPFSSTDCSLPMTDSLKRGRKFDAFCVYTDSETNHAGSPQAGAALKEYRKKTGIDAKLVVVGMVSNNFSVADPNDPGMLDVVGFDTAAPNLISDFIRGEATSTAEDDEDASDLE